MVPFGAGSTAVTAAHFTPGGSCPQSLAVRYGCGRSFRGAADVPPALDCAAAAAPMTQITTTIQYFIDVSAPTSRPRVKTRPYVQQSKHVVRQTLRSVGSSDPMTRSFHRAAALS